VESSRDSSGAADRLIRLAGAQHGVILSLQVADLGVPRGLFRRFQRDGWVQRLRRGAWVVAEKPSAWHQTVAVSLLAGPSACLSHWTAASVQTLPHIQAGDLLEISVPRPRVVRMQGVVVHPVPPWASQDTTVSRGLPLTSPARTFVDIASRLPDSLYERAIDEGVVRRLWTPASLLDTLDRAPVSPATGALRAILGGRAGQPTADSPFEQRAVRALACFRPFEVHHQVVIDGRLYLVDIAWPRLLVAAECDGWRYHDRTRGQFDSERRRNNALTAAGWAVAHLTSRMSDDEMRGAVYRLLMSRAGALAAGA
jgi:very-short-patch-repair endonuclease